MRLLLVGATLVATGAGSMEATPCSEARSQAMEQLASALGGRRAGSAFTVELHCKKAEGGHEDGLTVNEFFLSRLALSYRSTGTECDSPGILAQAFRLPLRAFLDMVDPTGREDVMVQTTISDDGEDIREAYDVHVGDAKAAREMEGLGPGEVITSTNQDVLLPVEFEWLSAVGVLLICAAIFAFLALAVQDGGAEP